LHDVRYYPEAVPETALLRNGDLLFTRYNGSPDLAAVCGMVRGLKQDTAYPDKLIRVRLSDTVDPWFAELMCAAPKSREWLAMHIKTAAGQHGISGADLRRLPIPLPPLTSQRAIIGRAGTAFTWIDRLAANATSTRKLIAHLDQAILAKAFRGELVPQSPTDEPAPALLARIRAEREATARRS
jgi:type I restriction enzyme S subunit